MPAMAYDALPNISDRTMAVNYGFEKVRLMSPVLKDVVRRSPKEYMMCSEVTVEIEGESKPALKAEWLGISYTG